MTDQKPFRVIIVGGGLVGLTAAHIFSKADIDFVILEKHESITSTFGSTLAVWPQLSRIFDQLGLLPSLQPLLELVERAFLITPHDARVRMVDEVPSMIRENHGRPVYLTHRPNIARLLYESLPDSAKARIATKKHVVGVDVSEDGVKVTCGDGSSYAGSIVIGADGVRSTIRRHVLAHHLGKPVEDLPSDQKNPYVSTYRVYFGTTANPPSDLERLTRWDGASDGMCTQIIVGANRIWYGVYEKLDAPTSEHRRYTEADKAEVLRKWGDLYVCPGWKVRDIDAVRDGDATMIDLEEGLVDTWYWKRLVLVGDAVRKMEPHAGLGYNAGALDIVALANALRQLLLRSSGGAAPSTQELEALFGRYQADRAQETLKGAELSAKGVRYLAWPTWKERALSMYALPYLPLGRLLANNELAPFISGAPVLEWLDEKELPLSRKPWKHHPSQNKRLADSKESGSGPSYTVFLLSSALLVVTLGVYWRI